MENLRPSSVTVWKKLSVKTKNEKEINVKIQDVPHGREEEIATFMSTNFLPEETWVKSCGIADNPEAIEGFKSTFLKVITYSPVLVCVADNNDNGFEIIAVSALVPSKRGETKKMEEAFQPNNEAITKMFKIFGTLNPKNPIYDKYAVEQYLVGAGTFVLPSYRLCGIGTAMLKTRIPLAKTLGMKAIGHWSTGLDSQKTSHKAGYERLATFSYEDLSKDVGFTFCNTTPNYTFDAVKIE